MAWGEHCFVHTLTTIQQPYGVLDRFVKTDSPDQRLDAGLLAREIALKKSKKKNMHLCCEVSYTPDVSCSLPLDAMQPVHSLVVLLVTMHQVGHLGADGA